MQDFDYAFTLVGLILGLAVAELLSKLVRPLRRHRFRHAGLLTPLLGAAVICDLTTFWGMIAGFRGRDIDLYVALFLGMLISSIYYVAATMVFPPDEDADHDAHYFAANRTVFGLLLAVNLPIFLYQIHSWALDTYVMNGLWLTLVLVAMAVKGKRANIVAIAALLLLYVYMFFADVIAGLVAR